MSQELDTAIAVIGIDIGKNSFHVVGHDKRGAIVLRQKWSRGEVETRLANLPPCRPSRSSLRATDDGPRHRAAHLERHGGRDRRGRSVLEGSRLRCLARIGAQTDIDRRPHHPGQDIETRQSLPARSVRAGGAGSVTGSNRGSKRPRSDCTTRAGDCARQQARSHRLGDWRSAAWHAPRLHGSTPKKDTDSFNRRGAVEERDVFVHISAIQRAGLERRASVIRRKRATTIAGHAE